MELEDWDKDKGQNDVYIKSWTVQNSTSSARSGERSKHVANRYVHNTVNSQVTIDASIFGQCLRLLKVLQKTSGPNKDCTGTTFDDQCFIEIKEMLLPRDRYKYLGNIIQPGRLGVPRNETELVRRLQQSANVPGLKSSLGFCKVYWWLVPNFACKAARWNRYLEKDQPSSFGRENATESLGSKHSSRQYFLN